MDIEPEVRVIQLHSWISQGSDGEGEDEGPHDEGGDDGSGGEGGDDPSKPVRAYSASIRRFLQDKHPNKFAGYQQYDFARSFYFDMVRAELFNQYADFADSHCDYLSKDLESGAVWARIAT
jgi:hypothetical protein